MREQMTPSRVLEEYDIVGRKIPEKLIREMREKYRALEAGGAHVWKMLCEEVTLPAEMETLEAVERKIAEDRLWVVQGCAEVMMERPGGKKQRTRDLLPWREKIDALSCPQDFRRLIVIFGIPEEKWRQEHWLARRASLPSEEGGIEKSLFGLAETIRKRFGSHLEFVAWMDGKEKPEPTFVDIVDAWKHPKDALRTFEELGVVCQQWQNANWLQRLAKLPKKDGGIGKSLCGLQGAIRNRFGSQKGFIDWMVSKKSGDTKSWSEIVQKWVSPRDALAFFQKAKISESVWSNSGKLNTHLIPTKAPGPGHQTTSGLCKEISKRFESFPLFVAWMKNSQLEPNWKNVVHSWCKPEDAMNTFSELKIPRERWRSSSWLTRKASLPTHEGGIGKTLSGLRAAIFERFESHPAFVAWMDESEIPKKYKEVVLSWQKPSDALQYFSEINVPGEKWKSSMWMNNIASTSRVKGGIECSLTGLTVAIRERYDSHRKFVAWITEQEEKKPWTQQVSNWGSPNDAIEYLRRIGVPDELWKSAHWMRRIAKKNPEDGGIANNLDGLWSAIRRRFGGQDMWVATIDSRLPFNGFTSEKQVQQYLRREILRLRESGNWIQGPTEGNHITKEEWDEVTKEEYYRKNPVVRAVTDYINSRSRES